MTRTHPHPCSRGPSFGRQAAISILAAAAVAVCATGCSTFVPFTQELRDEHHFSPGELQNLQFYVSHRIVLRREVERDARQITPGHALLVVSGRTVEEVVVEEGTPGVAVGVGPSSLAISFEPGLAVEFGTSGARPAADPVTSGFAEPPNPFPGNHPRPLPLVTDSNPGYFGNYWLTVGPVGAVMYGDKAFTAIESSGQSHLMINAESLDRVVRSHKVLPGMVLTGG